MVQVVGFRVGARREHPYPLNYLALRLTVNQSKTSINHAVTYVFQDFGFHGSITGKQKAG